VNPVFASAADNWAALVVAIVVAGFLITALVYPERF
jgi:hypothetical protein